jgi:hypothetical protein
VPTSEAWLASAQREIAEREYLAADEVCARMPGAAALSNEGANPSGHGGVIDPRR